MVKQLKVSLESEIFAERKILQLLHMISDTYSTNKSHRLSLTKVIIASKHKKY